MGCEDSKIGLDGTIYRKNWQGDWEPERNGLGHPKTDRDFLGTPHIERSFLVGNVRARSPSPFGGDLIAKDGTPLYERSSCDSNSFGGVSSTETADSSSSSYSGSDAPSRSYSPPTQTSDSDGIGIWLIFILIIAIAFVSNSFPGISHAVNTINSVSKSATGLSLPSNIVSDSHEPRGTVNADKGLRLRAGPSTDFARLDGLPKGTLLTIDGRNANGDWLKVRVPSLSKSGWVMTEFVNFDVRASSIPVLRDAQTSVNTSGPTVLPNSAANTSFTATDCKAVIPPQGVKIDCFAEPAVIMRGNCSTLHWGIENVKEIRLDNAPVEGWAEKRVCPESTTTYTWDMLQRDGKHFQFSILVRVQ